MRGSIWRCVRGLGLAVAAAALIGAPAWASESPMIAPPPASAAAPPPTAAGLVPPSAEALALARTLSHDLLAQVDFQVMMAKGLPDIEQAAAAFAEIRPEWPGIMKTVMLEELAGAKPVFEEVIAERFAAGFTVGELRAGVRLFEGPAGRDLGAVVAASAEGRPVPPLSAAGRQGLGALSASADGRGFIQKFGHMDDLMRPAGAEFAARVIPNIFIRFGQKAQAAEAARRPSN